MKVTRLFFLIVLCSFGEIGHSEELRVGYFESEVKTKAASKSGTFHNQIFLKQIGQTLVEIGPRGELLPGLAERWTISPDRKNYRFNLRPGVTFHDGTGVSAQDVVSSLNRAIYSSDSPNRYFFETIVGYNSGKRLQSCSGIKVITPETIEVQLSRPSASFLGALSSGAAAILKVKSGSIIGTGPYQIEQSDSLRLKAFDGYKGIYTSKIPQIKIVASTELYLSSRLPNSAESIDLDLFVTPAFLKNYSKPQYDIVETPMLMTSGFYLNTRRPRWKALVSRRELIGKLNEAVEKMSIDIPGARLKDLFPRGLLGHVESRLSFENMLHSGNLKKKTSRPQKISIATFGQILGDTKRFQSELSRTTGAEVEMRSIDISKNGLLAELASYDADAVFLNWVAMFPDPEASLVPFRATGLWSQSPRSVDFYRLIGNASEVTSDSERAKLYGEIADIVFEQALFLPVFQRNHVLAIRRGFKLPRSQYRYQQMLSEVEKELESAQ